ncbi:VirK/YbjX family protein [Collimonas sp.]|jgi:uncharacterized protein VirK/YbjX|uniref:VirK/YbjX family protein n=1 Tax=Collimonas sp. TaxID=1963772 RepID=UPI002C3F48BA|nr:VirK/YbjX family protein [Collimonas sp.]HWW04730.1 VirK/YbjX family protein [Collimonas sp.]
MHFKSDYRRALPSIALFPLLFADIESVWLGCAVPTFFLISSLFFNIPLRILKRVPATAVTGSKCVTLYTCLAHSRPGLSRLAKRIKLTVRGMLHYQVTQSWLVYWNATPIRVQLAKATPRLLQKIYRPYQSLRLQHRRARLNLLMNHYDFICQQGLAPLVLRASTSPVSLGSFTGKSGTVYEIRLASVATLDREGELALMLCCDRQQLFSIAFTFHHENLMPCIGIGCLQGPRGNDAQAQVRRATRDMFGLRPKSLMVRLAREIGHAYGCKKMILVGNQNRVLCHQVRTGKVLANYDDFWQEIGATGRPDGDYQLCCDEIPRPDLANIPSHKRAEARRRIELTEYAIQATLTGFSSNRI